MAYNRVFRYEHTGLREFDAYLKALGVPDEAVKAAMERSGASLVSYARQLAPEGKTGKLKGSIKANKSRSLLRVTAGNNTTVRHAYPFHAKSLGLSNGYFTATYPARGTRAGYKRVYPVRDYPFMKMAATAKQQQVVQDYITELVAMARRYA